MDGGPFRASRPVERRVASRPEPTYQQPEEKVEPKPPVAHRAPASPRRDVKEEKSFKRFLSPIVLAIIVIVLAIAGWFAWSNMGSSAGTAIDSSKYQAVFFTNGQVYFGKLQVFNDEYMKLTNIYYLRSQQAEDKDSKNPQSTSTDQDNIQLIKLGDEVHGPEDAMMISKDQLLFYENLKSDGKVAQSIEKSKKPE